MQDYIPLRAHSDYSFLRSSVTISTLVTRCLEENIKGLALTDCGNMHGSMEFFHLATELSTTHKKPILPIIGCEILLQGFPRDKDLCFEVTILVQNNQGYQNLVKIITQSHTKSYCSVRDRPVVLWDFLKKNSEGLIFLCGFFQGIVESVAKRDAKKIDGFFQEITKTFSSRVFLEVQRNPEGTFQNSQELENNIQTISTRFEIPIVATHSIFYMDPQDVYTNHLFFSIEKGSKNVQTQKGHHFLSVAEMNQLFESQKDWLANTVLLANQCNFCWKIPSIRMPKFSVEEDSSFDQLSKACWKGLESLGNHEKQDYKNRLLSELKIIDTMGFCDYFLVIADIVRFAKVNGILVGPGRGSAAGSLVSYTLGITIVDPIEYGLLFERFLNSERVSPPDIDIDFQDDRREEVIAYCRDRYGENRVAHIVTYAKLKPKAVFKDVAKLEGMNFSRSNEICQMISSHKSLENTYQENREFRDLMQSDEKIRQIFSSAKKLEGLTRQTGTHASGVIISDRDLNEYVPLFSDKEGNLCTQYEGKILEEYCGLVKMDLLGLKCLTVLQNAIALIREHYNKELDLEEISLKDAQTYKIFSQGRTMGVFQFESAGMQRYLRELRPTSIEDLTAMNAMYRPGPMSWIPVYIGKKHGQKVSFASQEDEKAFAKLEELCVQSPELGSILIPTNYIPIYQEQIMQIGQKYAGFELRQADLMRRAMGKKKKDVLASVREEFVRGAQNRGHAEIDATFLFDKIITPFSGYGFNKAHAVSYAVLAYRTAYIKSHYTDCFLVSLINSDIDQADRIAGYVKESYSHGISVVPPDINHSDVLFRLEKGENSVNHIVCGLQVVKGIANSAGKEIFLQRTKRGLYQSFLDFYSIHGDSSKLSRQSIEQLIKSGCFDSVEKDRGQLLDLWNQIANNASIQELLDPQNTSLFSENWSQNQSKSITTEDLLGKRSTVPTSFSILQKLEMEGLSFQLKYDSFLTALGAISTVEAGSKEQKFVCRIVEYRQFQDKNGKNMCFLRLSGTGGLQDGIVFPDILQEWCSQKKYEFPPQLLDFYKKEDQTLLFIGKRTSRFVVNQIYEWSFEQQSYVPIVVQTASKGPSSTPPFKKKKNTLITIQPKEISQQWIENLPKLSQFFQNISAGEGGIQFIFPCGGKRLSIQQRRNINIEEAKKKWQKEFSANTLKIHFHLQ